MDQKFCQSCAMPVDKATYGTNADGSQNTDYCKYCYAKGAFTADCTMENMIEFCVPHLVAAQPDMSENDARTRMQEIFPKLNRWKK